MEYNWLIIGTLILSFFFFFFFLFFENTKYFNTHRQGEKGEGFKKTNNSAYLILPLGEVAK